MQTDSLAITRLEQFGQRAELLGLYGPVQSIKKTISNYGSNAKWDWYGLDIALKTFLIEAGELGGHIREGILILDEMWLKLEKRNEKQKELTEENIFHLKTLEYERSERMERSLRSLDESIDCLLSKQLKDDKENPWCSLYESPYQTSAAYIALFGHLVRFGARTRALWETFRSLALLNGEDEKKAKQHFNRYLDVHFPGEKRTNAESISEAIAEGQFEDLGNNRIRFWVKEGGVDRQEEFTYLEIIRLCKIFEMKLVVAEMFFFYHDIIQRLYLSHEREVKRHRRDIRMDLLSQALSVTR